MNIRVEPGTWVVAVSGGVDSIVLLDLLHKRAERHPKQYKLIVAHFDHGIRPDSAEDRKLVAKLAKQYKLPFVYEQTNLGAGASEATARAARYEFLEKVRSSTNARGIITAHHEDDALETAVHNILRGTGRRGMSALKHTPDIQRPLLHISKQRLQQHAQSHNLTWREDSTNQDIKYVRNYIRHKLLSQFTAGQRAQLAILVAGSRAINEELDRHLTNLLHIQPHRQQLNRKWFIGLSHTVAREVVHAWLRSHQINNIDRPIIERSTVFIKTSKPGRMFSVDKNWSLHIKADVVELVARRDSKTATKSV